MAENFNPLLKEIGVNVELHDQLLAHNDRLHRKTHIGQKNRPAAMRLFDEALHASHGSRVKEICDYRKAGGKSIGTFCIYVPDEIALAADVLPIPLCGGTNWSVDHADKMFPRDICPLIRSTFGMAFSGTCPYKTLKDFAVGETTCDAKKKAWDLLGFKAMEVPQKKNKMDRDLWRQEVRAFRDAVENLSGKKVTAGDLRAQIGRMNRKRRALQRINAFRTLENPPISGLDALLVSQTALNMDLDAFSRAAEALGAELENRVKTGVGAYDKPGKRVLLAGTPSPMGNAKVHFVVETSGMRVVADESCTGVRYYRDLVDDSAKDLDGLLDAVADRYFKIDCACFSPNSERVENAISLAREYKVQGVVHNILQYCHGFNVEAKALENAFQKMGIPSLKIVTDYSEQDVENLRVRAQAFAEMLVAPAAACCAAQATSVKKS